MKIVNNALSIGTVSGIPIRLHISLVIVIVLLALFSGVGLLGIMILTIGIFGSVALHELGHSFVARAKGSYIHEIVLYPFGGAAKVSNMPQRPLDEILVALAGPAVSLALALLCSRIRLLSFVGELNWMLFLFNLLPVFPMDGGRVLRAALTGRKGRIEATRIAATLGKYFCWLFVMIGIFGLNVRLFDLIGPFSPNLMLAFIGFYIYRVGQMEYRMVRLEHQADHYSGHQEGSIDVVVSPPPYAQAESRRDVLKERVKKLFRR